MTINTTAGSKLYIGTTAAIDFSANEAAIIADFNADTYTEVGEVEDLGELGDEAAEVTFTAIANKRVRKLKGSLNAGTMTVTAGDDPSDAGQIDMLAASKSQLDFNFKVVLNDQLTLSGAPTTQFFRGKVMSRRRNMGTVDNVVRRSFNIGVNSDVIEVAAT